MTGMRLIDRLGIRGRVLILAMLPVLVVALVLGYTLITSRLDDARAALDEQGRIVARNLALAAEFPTFSKNTEMLERIVAGVAAEPEVLWAAVWDRERAVVFSTGGELPDFGAVLAWVEGGVGEFDGIYHQPIGAGLAPIIDFAEEFAFTDFAGEIGTGTENLGWALVAMSTQGVIQRESDIVRGSLVITLGGVLFSLLFGLTIGNGITDPIRRLMDAVQRLREGQLGTRVRRSAGGEIGELESGINQMANALEEGQATLQERVEIATTALRDSVVELEHKNRELEAARQAALQAGHERTLFLARMSHEIRTPLNAVVGFTRLLNERRAGTPPEEYIRTIQAASQQLQHVIDDILQFIKLDADAAELERLEFDPADCLEDVVTMLGPMAAEKGLELSLLLHSDLPATLAGDPGRLAQVIVNLANNAIKFTEGGYVVIEAGFATAEDGTDRLEITVADTGPGLAPEEQGRIFSAFSQGDSSVTRRYGGTGLGLSIAKRLVELMGGEIGLSSRAGQGSRFSVSIPSDGHSAPHDIDAVTGLAGRTALVYDENGFTRRALRGMLFGWGMQPFNTGKLDNLASLLENQQYDLVVLGLSIAQSEPDAARRILGEVRARYEGPLAVLSGVPGWQPPAGSEIDLRLTTGLKPARRSHLKALLRSLLLEMSPLPERGITDPSHRSSLSGLRILAAEDNEFNRLLLRELLESRGASVELAVNGRDALDKASFQAFDLVLMDLHMPELDGARATRRIRERLGDASPPIIALTADVFGESHASADEAKFSAWLLKPIDPARLEEVLQQLGIARNRLPGDGEAGIGGKPIGASLPPDLRQRYRAELRSLCRSARLALTDGDARGLRDCAHDLLGVVGVMGATDVVAIAEQLDGAAKAGDTGRCAQLLQALEQANERRHAREVTQTS